MKWEVGNTEGCSDLSHTTALLGMETTTDMESTKVLPCDLGQLWVGLALGQGDKAAFGEVDILRQLQVLKETTTPVLFTVDHHFTYDSKLHQLQFVNTRQHLSVLLDERQ